MARRKRREKGRPPKARAPKPTPQAQAQQFPNAKAEPVPVEVQLRQVQQTEVGSVCPACGITINAVMPHQAVIALRHGKQLAVQCGACGQPMALRYTGARQRTQIVTPGEDMALRMAGR